MFTRLSNGIALARCSWRVLMTDKHLLVFPVVSGVLFLLVLASFAVPLVTLIDWAKLDTQVDRTGRPPLWVYPVVFAFYFCTYFVAVFCNAALLSCALMRFHGQTPTVGDGFRAAFARLPQIAAWALVSATVGLLLKAVENAHEKVGRVVAAVLGTAWSVMTYFVVPVLVVEKTGPVAAVSRSVSLLRRTWGEAAAGNLGLGLFLFLLGVPVALVLVAGVVLVAKGMVAVGLVLLAVGMVAVLLHTAVSTALNTILLGAVYQYAADGRVPDEFDADAVRGAFAPASA